MAKEEKKEAEQKEGEAAPKKSKTKLIIIIAIVVVLLAGGGAFFALGGKKEGDGEEATDEEADAGHEEEGGAEGELPGAVVPLDVFIVNLGVKGSFLKTSIQLELMTPEPGKDFERSIPKIRDAVIRVLSGKVAAEILAADGKEKAREEIKKAVNDTLGSEEVVAVYFTEFIVQ